MENHILITQDISSTPCETTMELYTWFFKAEKGEFLTKTESKRKAIAERLLNMLQESEKTPEINMEELLSSIDLKRKVIKLLEKSDKNEHFKNVIHLFHNDIHNAEERKHKIQSVLKNNKWRQVLKFVTSSSASSVHVLEIFNSVSTVVSGFKKVDLINETFWGLRADLRANNAINKKRDEILLKESMKILMTVDQIKNRIDRIKTVEKLYIKVQAPKFPFNPYSETEKYVEKFGDELVLKECPMILKEIDEQKKGEERLNSIKELYGLTRVNSASRELVEKKWDIAATEEFPMLMEKVNKFQDGLERLEEIRNLWQNTRMGSTVEATIVEYWEKTVSKEFNNIVSEIGKETSKPAVEKKMNRLWVTIARFPEKRKVFKEILEQMLSHASEDEDTFDLHY